MKRCVAFSLLPLAACSVAANDYIVIGWNDLGMHCGNKFFAKTVVLPPFNTVMAQVIKVGDAITLPQVINEGIHITYEIPGNTYSVGKTDFWDYEDKLFGKDLEPNVGLTGLGLTGHLEATGDHFIAEGIPITPYTDTDLEHEDPFQLALLKAYDSRGNLLATTQPVVTVSNEINCVSSGCHAGEDDILETHVRKGGFDPKSTPMLCASCHSSNALGTKGQPGAASLSESLHARHAEFTADCFKCHPGPNTQCLRGVMKTQHGMSCQDCHGDMRQMAQSIRDGRQPWLQEPACGSEDCHGADYAEESGKLFRMSKGHGGLYCSACHGSPHAILPSGQERDNVQSLALQNHAGTLAQCSTCHGVTPSGPGPHGITAANASRE